MTLSNSSLPAGFEALEPFVETWAIDNAGRRAEMRGEAGAEARQAYYDAASPLLASALDFLDGKPLADFDEREKRLMVMMLSLAHVAIAVEVQQEDEERHAHLRTFMPITRAPADF